MLINSTLLTAVSDNVMPLVSQILLDSVLDRDFLYLPRKYLAYDHQAAPYKLGSNGGEALHLSLIEELMSDGSIRLDKVRVLLWFFFFPLRFHP